MMTFLMPKELASNSSPSQTTLDSRDIVLEENELSCKVRQSNVIVHTQPFSMRVIYKPLQRGHTCPGTQSTIWSLVESEKILMNFLYL